MGVIAVSVRPNRPVEAVVRLLPRQSCPRTAYDVPDTFIGVAAGGHCNSGQA